MYIKDHPEIIIIDPMESIHKLFDRTKSYQIMKECEILEEGLCEVLISLCTEYIWSNYYCCQKSIIK